MPKITPAYARQLRQMADAEREKPNLLPGKTAEETAAIDAQWTERLRPQLIEAARAQMEAQRADLKALDAKGPGQGLALEDVVDFLLSKDGERLRLGLEKALAPDRATYLDESTQAWSTAPRDGFEATVREALKGNLMLGPDRSAIVRAMMKGFATLTGSDGRIDVDAMRSMAKGTGAKVYDYIADATGGARQANSSAGTKLEGLDDATVARIGRGVDIEPILSRMKGLEALASELLQGAQPFKDVKVVCLQHVLPTFGGVLQQLEKAGAKREDIRVIGKSYSTVDEMYAWLVGNGYQTHPCSIGGNAASVEERLVEAAKGVLTEMFDGVDPKTSKQRFVLADDGGKLLYTLHKHFPEYAHLCVGFEQTGRGIQVLEKMKAEGLELKCPVVNMAQSPLKAESEIPMIGENVVFDALRYLDELKLKAPKTATVLGFGAVGQYTVAALRRRGIEVAVYDPIFDKSPEARAQAIAAGCKPLTRDEALGFGDMVIGCTGRGAMTLEDYPKLKDGAVLVNGASGNHEMGGSAFGTKGRWFREQAYEPEKMTVRDGNVSALFQGQRLELGRGDLGAASQHRIVKDHETGKEALVLRSGHVVNLGSDLPPELIQVTRALVFSCMVQALSEKEPGVIPVQQRIQDLIRKTVGADVARLGLSFENPDFRDIVPWSL